MRGGRREGGRREGGGGGEEWDEKMRSTPLVWMVRPVCPPIGPTYLLVLQLFSKGRIAESVYDLFVEEVFETFHIHPVLQNTEVN